MVLRRLQLKGKELAVKDFLIENSSYQAYDEFPVYEKNDLWPDYTPVRTILKIWSPVADAVKLTIYSNGHDNKILETHLLTESEQGVWAITLQGDYKNRYYTFQLKFQGRYLEETPGIYANAVGVNGKRALILDLSISNPKGWNKHQSPILEHVGDVIIYELHLKDLSIHYSAGSYYPGKYLGAVEPDTINYQGFNTGIEHLKELGITHVHLLPVFDFHSIDESNPDMPQYNWGYDPQNYNVPEGSYSSNPYRGEVRIREFKEMIMRFHANGIRVILDVVYNHTGSTEHSNFNLEVPGYYYRHHKNGRLSNASGCGNETASERPMMRKFMIESCKHWVKEYKIDGFRFDLMAVHDIETMNQLSTELKRIDPNLFLYGEGWTACKSPLSVSKRALKKYTYKLKDIASFNDDIRDGIKGSVFDANGKGFVSGAYELAESVKFGIVAAGNHPQIDFQRINCSKEAWSKEPAQSIAYVSNHDNHTLFDKLKLSRPDASEEDIKKMHCLANAIVLTSQGIPFLHAGVEMMRSKNGAHNTYNAPWRVNKIDWKLKTKNSDVYSYYQSLIQLRKNHPAFKMPTHDMIRIHLRFKNTSTPGVIAFHIHGSANGDTWNNILVIYNASEHDFSYSIPDGRWNIAARGLEINQNGLGTVQKTVSVPAISMGILFQY